MTAKELIEQLSKVAPETEIVGGMWNGKADTYTVMDTLQVIPYDEIYADLYGTLGPFDDRLLKISSKDVVYLGSMFESLDKQVIDNRRVICRIQRIMHMHRSKEWKQERIFKLLEKFERDDS